MKRLLTVLALSAAALCAQADEEVRKIVPLKYADPQSVAMLLANFGVSARADDRLHVLAITGRRANVTTAEEAIKQLDTPSSAQKDIDLTVYFVLGTDEASVAGAGAVPADVQSAVAALKSTFPFKTYALLDALSLRTRSSAGAETSGQLPGNRVTTFKIRSATVEGDNNNIRLDHLHAGLRTPHTVVTGSSTQKVESRVEYMETGISTDLVDIKEGQKLVVGRTSLDGPNKALFLILIAKIAQ